jgi:ligand-binding SRPBCC domain-containing protein
MGVLRLITRIRAPRERCFDLARSMELHMDSTSRTGERAIAGVTTGLLGPGEQVTWRARHLGVWQTLTSRMTIFDPPHHFRDSMVEGAFARFDHDHFFEQEGEICVMRDVFDFASPLGALGRLVDRVFLDGYLERFLVERNELIRQAAESEAWRRYLPGSR